MKKKIFVRKLISLGIATAGIGSVALPVVAASPVLASETVVTQEDLDAKKAELDRAQAEYDEALERQQAARDVVVNAERARDEAQEAYDRSMENYSKGYAGFLQFCIENLKGHYNDQDRSFNEEFDIRYDTEEVDILVANRFPGYEKYLADERVKSNIEWDLYKPFRYMKPDVMGNSDSPTDLTRVYYTLDWMEAVESSEVTYTLLASDVISEPTGWVPELGILIHADFAPSMDHDESFVISDFNISHKLMLQTMDFATFLANDYNDMQNTAKVGEVIEYNGWEIEGLDDDYRLYKFYYMLLNEKSPDTSYYDINQRFHYTGQFPKELFNFKVVDEYPSAVIDKRNSNKKYKVYETEGQIPEDVYFQHRSPEEICDIYDNTERYEWIYTISEEMSSSPTMGFAIGSSEQGDFIVWCTLDGSDGSADCTLSEYMQAFRDYYSSVDPNLKRAAFMEKDNDLSNARKELSMADGLLSEKLGNFKEAQDDYDKAAASFEAFFNKGLQIGESYGEVSSELQQQIDEEQEITNSEAEAINAYNAAEIVSHNEVEITENAELFEPLHKPQSEEIAFTEKEVETADTGAVEASQDVQKNARNEQGVLAEVLTYIFNGGAIAFIIPSGFIRRKSDKKILV